MKPIEGAGVPPKGRAWDGQKKGKNAGCTPMRRIGREPLPSVLRMVDGVAAGLDRGRRIEALGDAWVPLQAAAAWKILGGPS